MGNGNVYVSTKCLHSCNQLATINCYYRMVTIKHTRVSDVGDDYQLDDGDACVFECGLYIASCFKKKIYFNTLNS